MNQIEQQHLPGTTGVNDSGCPIKRDPGASWSARLRGIGAESTFARGH